MVVVFSKEKPQHCGNCKEKLETVCFRCLECGEIVSCPNCDPRSCHEDRDPRSRPFDHRPCSRGPFAPRGRTFDPSFSCRRGGFSLRGFMSRPNFSTTVPLPGVNRGCGFGPRGFGDVPPRCPFPSSFRHMSEHGGIDDFSEMHGRGFGPFTPRGHAGFPRGLPGRGFARGRGGFCRGRGGMMPFSCFQGMGCNQCDCNHLSVYPEKVRENVADRREGVDVVEMGEESHFPDAGGNTVEENADDAMGLISMKPVNTDHEG